MSRLTLALALTASTLALAGCDFHIGEDTAGETGKLRFEYSSNDCLFGCGLDKLALEGSKVTVVATGGEPGTRMSARLASGAFAKISDQRENCTCKSDKATRLVDAVESCKVGETRESCSLAVDIETTGSGDAKLEIVDGAAKLTDRVTVKVRPAARINITARANGKDLTATDGAFDVKLGDALEIETDVLGADGGQMIFTEHGVHHAYGDEAVLRANKKELIGRTDVQSIVTGRAGETTVTISAPGAQTVARFRVR